MLALKEILNEAREAGASEVTISGITYKINPLSVVTPVSAVPEMKAEELVNPLSILDEFTEEEIIYYSSPYFHELQAQKEVQEKQKQEDDLLKKELTN